MSSQLQGRTHDNDFILRRGITVDWYRSMYCPCRDMKSGQPDYNCWACSGIGRIFDNPVAIKILVTNVKQDKSYSIVGVWELGTCRATFPAGISVGNFDKIVFKNLMMTFSEHKIRAERFPDKDILRFTDVENVLKLKTLSHEYTAGTDFEVVKSADYAVIRWITSGQKPVDGEIYSILYEHRPEFICWDVPQVRSDSDETQLPKFAVLRRKDMVEQKNV